MNRLVYFYIIYLLFFFLIWLFYVLSAFLTVTSIPVPSFLFYTPLTREIFFGLQILAIPLLFLPFYFISGESKVLGLVIVYYIFLAISYFLPNVFIYLLLGFIGLALYISVTSSSTSVISKVLWGISSIYLILVIFNYYLTISVYSIFIIPSIIASGIEIIKNIE